MADLITLSVIKQDLVKSDIALRDILSDIQKDGASHPVALEHLASQSHAKIQKMKANIKALRSLGLGMSDAADKETVMQEALEHEKGVLHVHRAVRAALVKAQQDSRERERSELLGGSVVRQRGGDLSRAGALQQSSELTTDLLTVTRMIQSNTEKSTEMLNSLSDSSCTLGSIDRELKNMGSVLGRSKQILNKYARRENTDKVLIFIGLIFFFACCLVVVRNRTWLGAIPSVV